MAQVICTLTNASSLISGVSFSTCDEGMISEEISDEVAARFLTIGGYKAALVAEEAAEEPKQRQVRVRKITQITE